jgi:peptide/nickel transport system permease protein
MILRPSWRGGDQQVFAYSVRRLLALVPTIFFASVIVFVSVRLIPGSVIDLMLANNPLAVEKDRGAIEAALGLDKPMYVQYFNWVGDIARGDLGRSLWQDTPVTHEILARLPVTLELALLAMLISILLGVPIGVYSAIRQDTAGDYATRSVSILLLAVPSFWLATLVMVFPSIWWGWAPVLQYVPFSKDPVNNLKMLLLPAFILGTGLSALNMRLMRTTMLEVMRQDYIRTAWAKGLNEPLVVIRHALRNALIPVVTLLGLEVAGVIGGSVILEQIFVLPGMGLLLIEAVGTRDYPVITGIFLVVGVCVMLVNLLVDLSYGLLDPKVRYQ